MKRIMAVAVVVMSVVFAWAQTFGSPEDEAAIRAIVDHWRESWDKFDPSVLQGDYTDDADWLNAFGVRQKGAANILAFVSQVVKRPTTQGRRTTWDPIQVRFLRSDVAIASRDYRTVGHRTPDGKEIPERRTHSTWVLTKEKGKWLIASQHISDEVKAQ